MHHEFVFTRSSESSPLPPRAAASSASTANPNRSRRPAAWAELHRRALSVQGDDSVWLEDFGRRVIGSCHCRDQWRADLIIVPPDFAHYFTWTVEMHNRVNRRLGKPILTLEEAYRTWST